MNGDNVHNWNRYRSADHKISEDGIDDKDDKYSHADYTNGHESVNHDYNINGLDCNHDGNDASSQKSYQRDKVDFDSKKDTSLTSKKRIKAFNSSTTPVARQTLQLGLKRS